MNGLSRACWIGIALSTLGLAQSNFSVYQPSGVVATPTMVLVSTPFCSPGNLISPPLNLPRQILQFSPSGGTPTVFSDLSSLPKANIQCTTDGMAGFDSYLVMSQCTCGGFSQGDVFVQLNNQIYKIPPAGGTPVLFSTLPEYLHGMTFDGVGTFGYNLVVLTHNAHTGGAVYTVDSTGKVTGPLISQSTELVNPLVAPFNYGTIKQGDLLMAGYNGTIYDMTPSTTGTGYTVTAFATGFDEPEGIDFIPQNFITYYDAIQGPTDSDEQNEQNPNPSFIETFAPSFFSGYGGRMLVRNESFQPSQPGGTIYAVDSAGVKKSLGYAPGEQEGAMFVTSNVSLLCPASTGQLGTAYSSAVVASGGAPPYAYKLTSGSLPPGLSLNAQTGAITGIPTTIGTFSFTIQAHDSTGQPAGLAVIHCCITISSATLAAACPANTGTVGVAYSSSVSVTGGVPPYTFSVTKGTLPAGLSLNASTGAVTGTPTKAGTFAFGIKVVDSTGTAVVISCSITISAPPLTLTCPAGTGQVGIPYSSALVAGGGIPPYTFGIPKGLPPGLSLNTSTGAITGTPTTSGTYSFSATVADSTGKTTTITCSITIAPAQLTLNCPSTSGQVGIAYSSALTATGGVPPYTFTIASGSLPPGLTLNAQTGAITGKPTKAGTYSFGASVKDSTGATQGAQCTITIAPSTLSLTCPTGTGQVGTPYQSALTASGGTPPYTFSISSGSLPAGLSLNASTGAITGTPTMAQTASFGATVTDSTGVVATIKCSIVIAPATLTLTCPAGTGQVGVSYSSALTASGGLPPYTFSVSGGGATGPLPPGLTLNASTGAITGKPTTYGTYSFTATVTDSTGKSTSISCSITIAPATLTLTCPSGTGQVGIAYSSALTASGGEPPYTFSISTGSLPPGLTLNAQTGAITGTPTKAGTYSFAATVADSTGASKSAQCSITIAPSTLSLKCPSGTGQVGVAYSSALTASGGTPPYAFSISSGSLPAGLSLNTSTGAITGTPTMAQTASFSATVTDSTGVAVTIKCSIVIAPAQLTLTCPAATGQVGIPYSSALTAAGGVTPYTFSISSGALPGGLSLNASTGAVTGLPTKAGTFTFGATVTDSTGKTATISCTITVAPSTLSLTCPANTGQVGIAYSSALAASGGTPPYTFSIGSGSLPPGLTLNTSTGAITGTPTTAGAFSFVAVVTDAHGVKAGMKCTITISPPTLTLTCPAGTGQVGVGYSSALTASGGVPPYTFSVSGAPEARRKSTTSGLPPGLTLNSSTGAITGTPTTYGTFSFSATVTDSKGTTTTITCTITIAPATLTLTCPAATGQVGIGYSSALTANGGETPYTFSISSGALPGGLTLNTSTGAITGIPNKAGAFTFGATVTDSTGTATTISCTITIAASTLSLTCPANTGQVGTAYSSALTASGGTAPYKYSISKGSLPPGLTLDTSTGTITGTPTKAGAFSFAATVTDAHGVVSTTKCTITIAAAPLTLNCPASKGRVGVSYSSALRASGGVPPYTFSVSGGGALDSRRAPGATGGPLPPGLSLNTSTGAITGSPTSPGTYSFTATVTDSTGATTSISCSITIAPAQLTLSCPASSGQTGVPYSSALSASGGVPPYTFSVSGGGTTLRRTHTSVSGLPPGLSLNTSTGAITGTPTSPGTYSFTATVTDSIGATATINCTITIAAPPLTISCPSGSGVTNTPYSSSAIANGGVPPYTFSITGGSLPGGLTLNPATGAITGSPNSPGTFSFTITVTDSAGATASASCAITITTSIPPLTVTCPAGSGVEGTAYSSSISATGGTAPYTFSITSGNLPTGLTLNPSTGAITGTPSAAATYTFRATVTDSTGASASSGCVIIIAPPGTPLSLSCPNTGQVGSSYNSGVAAAGGIPPYTFSITSGSLPPGLTFNTTTGNITGTPTTAGTYSVTFQVADSATPTETATATCNMIIAPSGTLSTCVPSSSLSVLVQGGVAVAYIPNGSWSESGIGVDVVPIEGAAPPRAFIDTAGNPVNSCSSNWITGTTVCSGNGTDVYIINGTTLSSVVNSGGFGQSYFSGGDCLNCGVAIDAATNQAVIETSAGEGLGGMQFLDLGTNTFEPLISVPQFTSENIAVDPVLNLVLSPNEGYNSDAPDYQLLQFTPGTTANQLFNQANYSTYGGQTYDSAGLDCTTHIAISTEEFTGMLAIFDLTQATFDTTAGTWTAPSTNQEFPEFDGLGAGTSGMAVAPGSHLAIIAGEFGGNEFGVVQLPSNSGTGTPAVLDYVAAYVPTEPNGNFFENGLDPHTVTAYVSSNTGKALGLLVDDPRNYVALIDLQALLNAPRQPGSNYVDPSVDLVGTGIITFISIPAPYVLCPTAAWDQNDPYSSSFATSGLVPPETFSITGSLPPGLSVDSSGNVTGTPTTVGNYSFSVQVTDSVGTMVSASCGIAINAAPSISCPASAGTAGQPYSSSAAVTGGAPPYSFYISSGSLPTGLTLNSTTGAITGTPRVTGTNSFTITVTDATGASATTSDCGITIAPPPLTLTAPLSTGALTITYFSQVATGGTAPYTFSITPGSLPPGLTANSNGTISGVPTTKGTYNFTIQAMDAAGASTSESATISITALHPAVLASCQGVNAMSVLAQGGNVNAYVANGSWQERTSGIQLVPLEGSGTSLTSIPTSNEVSSCASNWVTGQTVCTGDQNEVYLVSGSTVTSTLFASGSGDEYFQDGQCVSCGVAIDASSNQATIEVATGFGAGGVQQLDLTSNTFGTPLTLPGQSAESVGMDPFRHWALSPNGGYYGPPDYAIVQNQPTPTLFDFASILSYFGSNDYLAAGAEDCTTGIALATQEYNANMLVTDLSQATFDPVAQQWNAPAQVQSFPEFYSLDDGANGLAIAGGSHLGLVTGIYCCSPSFAAIQLPSTSGSGTPSVTDYVVANFPTDPSGNYWQNSQGPILVSAYVSPNTGTALGVVGNDPRTYLALIDLQMLLAAARESGTHYIDPSVDLVGTGILKWVPVQPVILTCPQNEWITGSAYSSSVTAQNGFPPYTFSITGGSLPPGLSMSSGGNITGTPTATGVYTFTAQAVDSTGTAAGTGSMSCTITIAAPLALTAPTATGQAGMPYSSIIGVTGGFPPYYMYINSGSFPTGLNLNGNTGAITGTPTIPGAYSFQIYAYDSSGVTNAYGNFTITIAPAPLVTSCPLNTAQTSIMYFSQVASGGAAPYSVSVSSGSLPPGLSANTSSVIAGTPGSAGTYPFNLLVTDSAGNSATASGCSIAVSAPNPAVLAACQPANNISVLNQGGNVNAYFPAGSWGEYNYNVYVVPLEGSGSLATIPTSGPVNSCASNWATGQTVCVDNYSQVYLISGSTVTTTEGDSAFGYNYSYEGYCYTCGVMIDPSTNKAAISMALGEGSGVGIQFLDLATNTFESPVPVKTGSMETAAIDPIRHSVLISASFYQQNPILQTQPSTGVFYQSPIYYYNDSAAEDCTTGIALTTNNYDDALSIADLSQAFFDPIMGAWSAPSQAQSTPELGNLVEGPSGIAIAPGSHLGVVTGEYCCGPGFGAISLPATSGSGTPALVDYVEANFPNDPSGNTWYNGQAPHTVTAYLSPNTGKALGVVGNDSRTYLAVIDLQALLNAPRQSGTHYIDPTVDLVATGILTWISVQ